MNPKEKMTGVPKPPTIESIFEELAKKKTLPEGTCFWFAISGSWRKTNEEIEEAVRENVREILNRGGGVVSGGALNVDFFATDEVLKLDPTAKRIRVFLPATLGRYAAHYRKRAAEGIITEQQAEALIAQLTKLKEANPEALIEHPENTVIDKTTYYERNTEVMNSSDALLAFNVNKSGGVTDTVEKASQQGKPVRMLEYEIE